MQQCFKEKQEQRQRGTISKKCEGNINSEKERVNLKVLLLN
jgi:hypothetical protein